MKSFGTSSRTSHDSSSFYDRQLYGDAPEAATGHDADKRENRQVDASLLNRIYGHSSESMHELPDGSVHLMVTSPPYNVGKDYDDDLSMDEYRSLLCAVWRETLRVTEPGGRACINVANVGRKPYIPLNAMIAQDMIDIGWLMRGEIIWNKSASAGTSCAWGSWRSPSNPVLRDTHEYILVFSKGQFERRRKDGTPSIGRDEFLEFTKSVWNMPAESAKRVSHPAPFPVELPNRLIQLYTYKEDTVLDPFMGSGTTALAAQRSGRKWVGYEVSDTYIEVAKNRLQLPLFESFEATPNWMEGKGSADGKVT